MPVTNEFFPSMATLVITGWMTACKHSENYEVFPPASVAVAVMNEPPLTA